MNITATGQSGSIYHYTAFNKDSTNWADVKGNYMFAYLANNNSWTVLYIGITDSFKYRIPCHERWEEAKAMGATHVLAHTNINQSMMETEEKDLIASHTPPLNTHHQPNNSGPSKNAGLRGILYGK